MATPKSPFFIVEDFISAKQCEYIVDSLGFYEPDYDSDGAPIKMQRHHDLSEDVVYDQFKQLIPQLVNYYGFEYRGTERVGFEFLAQGVETEPHCENSKYINKKWARVFDRDFSCVLFLSDYQENVPFDSDFEVYGGKLEFPQHAFGFNPQRGTLIVYPSGPHFINANAAIIAGNAYQARFHVAAKMPFLYDPEEYPGNYLSWFPS